MKFLIDFENTNLSGLTGIEELGCSDKVIIFHTNQNDKMPFDLLAKIKCSLEFVRVSPGRQSLDMCLASRLGYLIGCKQGISAQLYCTCDDSNIEDIEPDDIIIVSKDTDYLSMAEMWNEQYHQCIGIRPTISGKTLRDTSPPDFNDIIKNDPDVTGDTYPAEDSYYASGLICENDKARGSDSSYSGYLQPQKSKKQKRKESDKANRIEQILKTKGMSREERQNMFRLIDRDPKRPNYKSDIYDEMCKILGHKNGRKAYQQVKQVL